MSDYSGNLDFSPTRQAKIAACEKLRDTVTGISALQKSLLDESLASSPTHRNSFSEIYRMSTQAMAMKKEEMVSELKTLPPCTRTDCNEHKIPTTLVAKEINSNDPISDEKTDIITNVKLFGSEVRPRHFTSLGFKTARPFTNKCRIASDSDVKN
ncbi:hypothetical protein TNIN_84731 [Trichonephila inaurata madagascariensis]|uniref:Uncharacterized protein n=1 Tax=Trichonephila inaurata madagascariensis TaxID=2747483 RepID=A0A8X6XN59_9ARAC|nr:hypothetical protein TNIN_84731 [Trichonephila inaurata madagascariensis]